VHILFKQATDGSIIIGDSHEYADAKEQDKLGFEVNQENQTILLLKRLNVSLIYPTGTMASYWNGYYGQSKKPRCI